MAPRKSKGKKRAIVDSDDDVPDQSKKLKATNLTKKDDNQSDEELEDLPEPTKSVKMVKKGRAPVDHLCSLVQTGHILEEGDDVYSCHLNQTNSANNNNKYYIIQVIQDDKDTTKCYCFTRWGRVGYDGSSNLDGPFSRDRAIGTFCKKFTDKTGNDFHERDDFEAKPRKYTLMDMDFGADQPEENDDDDGDQVVPESKLDPRVQELMQLFFNTSTMETTMTEFEVDLNRFPIGKISKAQIQKAYRILTSIQKLLGDDENAAGTSGKRTKKKKAPAYKKSTHMDLSNQFWTLIPHDLGFSVPPLINKELLEKKVRLIEALAEIEVASSIIQSGKKNKTVNPMDSHYDSVGADIRPVEEGSDTWNLVERMVVETHGPTHTTYKLKLTGLYEVDREGEAERYSAFEKLHDRRLLWHGSRLTNFAGLLRNGLKIAPPEAPMTGWMFGKGIYLADICSKSAQYCYTTRSKNTGFMILAESALGDKYECKAAEALAKPKNNNHSTWGIGRSTPDPAGDVKLENDVTCHTGKVIDAPDDYQDSSLQYNEFVVYDVAQVKMKYLVKLEFIYS